MTEHEPIGERMARVETKIDMVLERLDTSLDPLEERVSKLERWRAWVLGASAFFGAVASWIAHVLTK